MLHIQFVTCQGAAYLDEIFSNVSEILEGTVGESPPHSEHELCLSTC